MAPVDAGSMTPEELSRQQAEARRQKILNRGKERLTRITGGAAPVEPTGAVEAAAGAGVPSVSAQPLQPATPERTTPPSIPADNSTAALSADDAQAMQAMQQLMQQMVQSGLMGSGSTDVGSAGLNLGSPVFPTLPLAADSPLLLRPVGQSFPSAGAGSDLGGFSFVPGASSLTGTETAADTAKGTARALSPSTVASVAPSFVVAFFGPELQAAVRNTTGVRCLAAVLLAACLFYGVVDAEVLRLPPMLLLLATQVALILGAKTLSSRGMYKGYLPPSQSGEQMPLKMRSFDLAAFIPGLRPALTAVTAMTAMSSSLSAGVCMYIVTYSLLLASMRPIK